MGALSLAIVQKETEARNSGFLQQLAMYSSGAGYDYRQLPFWRPPVDRYSYGTWNFDSVDVPAAFAMYEQLKERVLTTGCFGAKVFRPYDHTNVTEMGLDPEQPWVGFEFETGYASADSMRKCLSYCWDSFDNVTFDSEGEGYHYSEVTFAPANLSSFLEQEAPASQYMKFLSDNRELTFRGDETAVGTHVNVSLPLMRNFSNETFNMLYNVTPALNRSLGTLDEDDNLDFFGRSRLYAGFFLNSDNKRNCWFEGKLFRTTYDYDVYKKYIRVSRGLIKAIEALVATKGDGFYVSNMYDLLTNPDAVEPIIGVSASYPSSPSMNADGYPTYEDDDESYDDYTDGCDCSECRANREDY